MNKQLNHLDLQSISINIIVCLLVAALFYDFWEQLTDSPCETDSQCEQIKE